MKQIHYRSGFSLVELMMAMALAALLLPALLSGLVSSREGKAQQNQRIIAIAQMKEVQDAVRSVRDKGWTTFAINGTFHPVISGSSWSLANGAVTTNGFTQQVTISDAYRDTGTGQIIGSGGSYDPSTKKVDITISWTEPRASSITSTYYLTRYQDNLAYIQTSQADFNTNTHNQTSVTNTAGGEVQLANNNKAKWCAPSFSNSTIDLPDGPPVAVAATASASIATPNDVLVATAPYTTSSAKLAYIHVSANTDPPASTLQGTFTLDASKYSDPGLVPSGIGLDNTFKTNDIKYYKSASGRVYALLATDLPNREVVVVQIKDGSGEAFQDPTNKIYKYWTYYNTVIYGSSGAGPTATPTHTPTPSNTPTPTSVPTNTGFLNPTANAADSGGDGDGYASNPTRGYSNNSSFAVDTNSGNGTGTSCNGADKDRHRYYNYGISIPAWATTTGIEVRLDARADSTSGAPQLCIQLSWDGGTTWTTAQSTSTLTTSEATYTLGNSSDTWGHSWTNGEFGNANFRVRVINVASNTSRDFSLDWVAVNVHYNGVVPTATITPTPTTAPTPTLVPTSAPGPNDQAPFGYGATSLAISGDTGYVSSGGYLYAFDLSTIDNKTPSSGLDGLGCRIQLDGYDCQPGSGQNKKYSAGQSGTTWSDTATPAHNDCSDGGNIELNATNDIYPVQVGGNKYIYVAIGAGTNPEFGIVNVSSIPSTGSSPSISSSSCGRISGGNSGWRRISSLDFNSQSNTEEAANSVYAKSEGTRAYISSNGGIDGNGDGQPDSKQFYVINTTDKNAPAFLSGTSGSGATSGYYAGDATQIQMFPRRSLTVLNGQRAVLVGKDGFPVDGTNPEEYQVIDISNESSPSYCDGVDLDAGFNDLTSVTEADSDNFVYMVVNANVNELKIIQGGPDGTYLDTGTLESPPFDAGYSIAFNKYITTVTRPTNTALSFQFAGADPVSGSCNGASYTYTGPDGTNGTFYTAATAAIALSTGPSYKNPAQCFRYKAYFSTTDYNATAVLQDMVVNFSP